MAEQRIHTTNGTELMLTATTIEQFQSRLRGELLKPGHDHYESARKIHNGMIDRHPALIVRCAGVADVMTAVTFARSQPGRGSPRRRPWRVGLCGLRRRPDDRPVAPAEGPRRPGAPHGPGGGWDHVGGIRPRNAGLRLSHVGRDCPPDWHRRAHTRRRPRLPDAHVRPGLR